MYTEIISVKGIKGFQQFDIVLDELTVLSWDHENYTRLVKLIKALRTTKNTETLRDKLSKDFQFEEEYEIRYQIYEKDNINNKLEYEIILSKDFDSMRGKKPFTKNSFMYLGDFMALENPTKQLKELYEILQKFYGYERILMTTNSVYILQTLGVLLTNKEGLMIHNMKIYEVSESGFINNLIGGIETEDGVVPCVDINNYCDVVQDIDMQYRKNIEK